MCSEYKLLAMLTVCTDRTIRQLLLTVHNSSAGVLDMTESLHTTQVPSQFLAS